MIRRRSILVPIGFLLTLLMSGAQSFAQEGKAEKSVLKEETKGEKRPMKLKDEKPPAKVALEVEGTFKYLGSKYSLGKMVKGAPYSATAVTESRQTLSDGNQIVRKNEARIYRDSEGRTRIDQRLETIGKWTANGEPPMMTLISDPVEAVAYSLDPRTQTAYRNPYMLPKLAHPGLGVRRVAPGEAIPAPGGEAATEKPGRVPSPAGRPLDFESKPKVATGPLGGKGSENRITESLGTQIIEGVSAEGTRTTLTIPAGEIGNSLPIQVVDEAWYSDELKLHVMTRHQDPRTGESIYRLTNISRAEPDRSLFEVPQGYTVEGPRPVPVPRPMKRD